MTAASNTTAIIPARYASTRLPGKPLIEFNGKPMIRHVYERVVQASLVGRTIVATDNDAIASAVRRFGGEVRMTPTDLRSGSDRVAFVAREIPGDPIIVNVQGDEPLIDPEMIDEAIRPLADDASVRVGTLVKEITHEADLRNPAVVKAVLDCNGDALYFSRAAIPHVRDAAAASTDHRFYRHIGLYVYRKETLLQFASWPETPLEQVEKLEQLRLLEHGIRIRATITQFDSLPVDTPQDVDLIHQRMKEPG